MGLLLAVGFLVLAVALWRPLLRMVTSWPAVFIGAGLCAWLLGSVELAELALARVPGARGCSAISSPRRRSSGPSAEKAQGETSGH